jgi:uncharacterized cupredoxin-like copper-binding protein
MHPIAKTFSRAACLRVAALALASGSTVVATVLAAAPASASTSTTTVKATETDFHIALSKTSFKTGKYVFDAVNKGQTTHALMITGPGIKMAMTKDIQPGQSATLAVTLKKGAYDIFCPIPGHKALGMNVNINVGGAATTSSGTGTPKSSGGGSTGGTSSAGGGGAAF